MQSKALVLDQRPQMLDVFANGIVELVSNKLRRLAEKNNELEQENERLRSRASRPVVTYSPEPSSLPSLRPASTPVTSYQKSAWFSVD